ncbi:MAG: MipA/OmpV family protein, partial [Candidatus Deferrimicrobiaceae bacterium]
MSRTPPRIAVLILCAALFPGLPPPVAAEMVPQWELGAGVAGLMLPDYRGSDEVRSYLLPVPYIIYRLEWIRADRDGIHSKLLNWERAEVNLSLSATPPVRSKNNRAREGMSDLKPMVELGPTLDIHLWHGDGRRYKLDARTPVRAA